MEGLLILIALYLFAAIVVYPIWGYMRMRSLDDANAHLHLKLQQLRDEVRRLEEKLAVRTEVPPVVVPVAPPAPKPAPAPVAPSRVAPPPVAPPSPEVTISLAASTPAEPVVTVPPVSPPAPRPAPATATTPPIIVPQAPPPVPPPVYVPPPPEPGWLDTINWEQFMGAKLFAWLGGLALFLGVAFFVKYSFDHDLIPPAVRVALGFVFGAGLVVGGLRINRERYRITAQTLIAAGIVSLYAVTFTCGHNFYGFLSVGPMFLLMALITTTAFVLAVRLEAQVVAVLGLLGGFLTPVLLSTGVDNPGGLFGYLALLDLGLVAVALHRGWFYLVPLGAGGTVLMMIGWAGKFYVPEKTTTAMTVCLGFCALYLAAVEAARRFGREHPLLGQTAIALPAIALGFAWVFAGHGDAAAGPVQLFGFIFLAGFFAFVLAWWESQGRLVALTGVATAILIGRWTAITFTPAQAPVVVTVCLAFCAVYFAAFLVARRSGRDVPAVLGAAALLPGVSLAFALFLIQQPVVSARPGLLLGFIFLADGFLLALAWLDERATRLSAVAGFAVFGLLAVWTTSGLTPAMLPWALAAYLVFAALHAVFPLVLARRRPDAAASGWSQLFPPLALVLMLLPLFRLETVPFLLWPAILLVDVLALGLAALSASLAAVAAVLVLTLLATAVSLFKLPVAAGLAPSLLLVIGFFAVFFFVAGFWLVRRLGDRLPRVAQLDGFLGDARSQIPAFSALLPFLLLIMACARFPLADPAPVFGLGLLLVVLTLGLSRLMVIEWLPACALAGMAALEYTWQAQHFRAAAPAEPLVWFTAFYAIFAAFPFLFRRTFAGLTGPWCVAALSGVVHFGVIYRSIRAGWPGSADYAGLVPAAFVLAPLGSLMVVLARIPADNPKRLNQLAWFGGVALLFITLIFPIQFERQWLTVAWALEGTALLWLFHRVPHRGLQAAGTVLLLVAFARLALNPAVLDYHPRSGAILNWYLYAYGLTVAALFCAARLSAPPRERALGLLLPAWFNVLGTVLAFLLLNIEIADFFAAPGTSTLTFQFSGNFARDMSYTIGWALFALGLLAAGLWQRQKAARYAAIALLSVALLKLFFHDLARLEALYRIGALFAVAVIAIVASVAYQRFLPGNEKSPPPAS